jgi:hypothetical protein
MSGIITDNLGRSSGLVKAASAGGVVQTVSYATGAVHSMTNTSWADISGFSVTITPTSSSNKILLMATFGSVTGSSCNTTGYKFARDGTEIGVGDTISSRDSGGWRTIGSHYSSGDHAYNASHFYIDSPSTTSATTYTIQNRCESGTAYINRSVAYSDNSGIYNAVYHSIFIAQEIV